MTLRAVVASGVLAVVAVAPVRADGNKAAVGVSAQVVRSCRVTSDQPQVSVNCGSRPQPVQVTVEGGIAGNRTVTNQTTVAADRPSTVTVLF
jgi:hypothetical protein